MKWGKGMKGLSKLLAVLLIVLMTTVLLLTGLKKVILAQEDNISTELQQASSLRVTSTFKGADGRRPNDFAIVIYDENQNIVATLDFENNKPIEKCGDSYTWEIKLSEGTYFVKEINSEVISNYLITSREGNSTYVEVIANQSEPINIEITNSYIKNYQSITVYRIWDDQDNQAQNRDACCFTLYANGKPIDTVKIFSDTVSYTWENLIIYKDRMEVNYTVAQTQIPNGYVSDQGASAVDFIDQKVTFTNTYQPSLYHNSN